MNTYDENVSLSELFNLELDAYSDMDISKLPLSMRVINRLHCQDIYTLGELLKINSAFLLDLNGFGKSGLNKLFEFLESLNKEKYTFGNKQNVGLKLAFRAAQMHRSQMLNGDFSFIYSDEYSLEVRNCLLNYKLAYEVLGKEFVEKSIYDTKHVLPITEAITQYNKKMSKYLEMKELEKGIPFQRRKNSCIYYINAYTLNEELRKKLIKCYSSENASLCSIIDSVNFEDKTYFDIAVKFLKWCSYDVSKQISELFDNLYSDERQKMVIEGRANHKTLNEVGDGLQITRERVRQIEKKVRRIFCSHYSRMRILSKIYADQNGQSIITQESIAEVSGDNANAFIYLLRISESSFYTYDDQMEVFVYGDTDIFSRLQHYIDSLPEVIKKTELQDILDSAKEQEDLAPEYVEKAIAESYRITGDVYHKTRLSLANVYEEVLRKYYPSGLYVYDDKEISELRRLIINEYGD